jgi:hypothetical protein
VPHARVFRHLRTSAFFGASLAALLLGLLPAVALADPVSVRAGERGAGARVVFDWPAPVTHAVRVQEGSVRLTFARPLETEVSAISGRVPGWIKGASLSADKLTLTLSLVKPASAQSFASGNKVVLDLVAAKPAPVKAETPKKDKPVAQQAPKPVVKAEVKPVVKPEAKPAPKPEPKAEETTVVPAAQLPAVAENNPPAPSPANSEAEQSVAPPVVAASALPTSTPPAPAAPAPIPAEAALPSQYIPPVAGALPPVNAAPAVASVAREVLPPEPAALDLTIPATTPVAVFTRGRAIYIAVNEAAAPRALEGWLDLASIKPESAQLLKGEGGRVLRLLRAADEPALYPVIVGTNWRLSPKVPTPAPAVLEVIPEPTYALGPRVLVKTEAAGNPVFFADPVIGDTLVAVPVAQPLASVLVRQQFVQAELLPSLQGVAVRLRSEDLSVISSPMGVELSAASGFKLSENAATALSTAVAAAAQQAGLKAPAPSLPPLFDFQELGAPAGPDFTNQRMALQTAITEAAPDDRNAARLELARFYFINGMATEAQALWDLAGKTQPELLKQPDYALIRSIAAFSSGTLAEATALLTAQTRPSKDLALWRALAAARARDWPLAQEHFGAAGERMWEYPNPYRYRLAMAAIETAMNTADYNLAEMLLDKLQENMGAFKDENRAALDYLGGQIAWYQKHPEEARAKLSSAATSWNNYWRVRAELALIDIDSATEKPDMTELTRRVERMRFAWRGDQLEYDVLERLARLHLQAGDYAAAFDDYAQITAKFPGNPRIAELKAEQQAAFVRIFQGDERDRTPAFVQLAIWDRFPEFRPPQPAVLDEVRSYLAERVAGIDLLDRAAGFYSDILKGTTEPAARAKLGTHIAGLWLLDRKADEALKALAETEPAKDKQASLSTAQQDERRILQARAIFGQGKPDEALALLASDYTEAAMRLRADITWQTRRWAEAAAVLDALIGDAPASGDKLSEESAGMVLSRATALALADDRRALANMRVEFGEAMASTPQAATFQLITRPDVAGGLPDRKTLGSRMAEVDLFGKVLERYRQPPSADGVTAVPQASDAVAQAPEKTIGPGTAAPTSRE